MNLGGKEVGWTYKEMEYNLGLSRRSVQLMRKRFKLRPIALCGNAFAFDPEQVKLANASRLENRLKKLGL